MDERSHVSVTRTAYLLGRASGPVTGRNMTRIGTTPSGSQRPRLTGAILLDRFARELIDPTRCGVPFDVTIPNKRTKFRQLLVGQFRDRGLDLLHGAHEERLSGQDCRASMIRQRPNDPRRRMARRLHLQEA